MVSIIIPTCGRGDILSCLRGLSANTSSEHEIIISANGCSRELIEQMQPFGKLVLSDQPVGFPVACNLGIKASLPRNDIVLLNDDIIIDIPNWLSVLQQGNGDLVGNQGLFGYGTWINGVPIQFEGISFACVLIRRKVLNVIGLLDESFSPGQGEDAEFCYRVERAGFSICYVELPMFHKGGQSFDMDTYKRQLELWTSKMANRIQSDLATCMGPWRCEEHRDVNNWIHCTQCLHNFNIWHTSNKWTWMQ